MDVLDAAVRRWLEPRLPAPIVARERRDDAGDRRPRAVLRLFLADGSTVHLKRHASPRAFDQEHEALARWPEVLPAAAAAAMPPLLDVHPPTRSLLLGSLPGRVVAAEAGTPVLHRAAGAWLARLHRAPIDGDERIADPMPLDEAVRRRIEAAVEAAREHDVGRARRVGSVLAARFEAAASSLRSRSRVRCHRDFGPWNWLADQEGTWHVIDFEHARLDAAAADLAKCAAGPWRTCPEARRAFLVAYDPADPGRLEQELALFVLLHGIVTWTWGMRHGDDVRRVEGDAVLRDEMDVAPTARSVTDRAVELRRRGRRGLLALGTDRRGVRAIRVVRGLLGVGGAVLLLAALVTGGTMIFGGITEPDRGRRYLLGLACGIGLGGGAALLLAGRDRLASLASEERRIVRTRRCRLCPGCGHSLRGLAAARCPECGRSRTGADSGVTDPS